MSLSLPWVLGWREVGISVIIIITIIIGKVGRSSGVDRLVLCVIMEWRGSSLEHWPWSTKENRNTKVLNIGSNGVLETLSLRHSRLWTSSLWAYHVVSRPARLEEYICLNDLTMNQSLVLSIAGSPNASNSAATWASNSTSPIFGDFHSS